MLCTVIFTIYTEIVLFYVALRKADCLENVEKYATQAFGRHSKQGRVDMYRRSFQALEADEIPRGVYDPSYSLLVCMPLLIDRH